MKIIKIENLDELNFDVKIDYEVFTDYLYHGTREWFIDNSEEQRNLFFDDCNKLLELLQPHKMLFDDYNCNGTSILFQYNRLFYKYGNFYVTNNLNNACLYANYIAGELGQAAFDLSKIVLENNLFSNTEIPPLCRKIKKKCEEISKTNPVILLVKNVKFTDIFGYSYAGRDEKELRPYCEEKEDIEFFYEDSQKEYIHRNFFINNFSYVFFAVRGSKINDLAAVKKIVCEYSFRDL